MLFSYYLKNRCKKQYAVNTIWMIMRAKRFRWYNYNPQLYLLSAAQFLLRVASIFALSPSVVHQLFNSSTRMEGSNHCRSRGQWFGSSKPSSSTCSDSATRNLLLTVLQCFVFLCSLVCGLLAIWSSARGFVQK